jgi:hypothetical protein
MSEKNGSPPPLSPQKNENENENGVTVHHQDHHCQDRPNHELSLSEKIVKRHLKKHLKQKIRLRKYETRWHQATARSDKGTEERARAEWQDYLEMLRKDLGSVLHQPEFSSSSSEPQQQPQEEQPPHNLESQTLQQGRKWIVQTVWQPLIHQILQKQQQQQQETSDSSTSSKQAHTDHARALLQSMTKGTQTEDMFDNDMALVGYTRQKFMERAILAVRSLDRLEAVNADLHTRLLQNCQQIGSIGCGPGCDAVGILSFLQYHNARKVERLVLMDYVMPQWKRLVVDALIPLLTPHHVARVETASCDVRYSLTHDLNHDLHSTSTTSSSSTTVLDNIMDLTSLDLIVVSYLLTETRGQWEDFFHDLLERLPSGALLLLSEPTAWKLHTFLKVYDDRIQTYQWLDSSRDSPEMQGLEGRMGPAVVLVCIL